MKRLFLSLIIVACIGGACAAALAWWAVSDLLHPQRRPLQDYHHEMLGQPAKFGLVIRPYETPASEPGRRPTPCLLCDPDTSSSPGARGQKLRQQLANKGVKLQAFGRTEGTVVLLHGRGGRKEDGLPVAERFFAAGLCCILLDLPAHGDNADDTATYGLKEWRLPDDALKEASRQFGIPARPRALWGISQGGAIAVQSAARTPWDALVVVSSFARLDDVCRAQAKKLFGPFSPPVYALVQNLASWRGGFRPDEVRPVDFARRTHVPVLIAHGTGDDLIPLHSGRELFNAFPGDDKQWIAVDGGTHGRVLATPQLVYAEMAAFFLKHFRQSPQ